MTKQYPKWGGHYEKRRRNPWNKWWISNTGLNHCKYNTFENKKTTDIKLNNRVQIAEPLDVTFETKNNNLKIEVMKVVDSFHKRDDKTEFSYLNQSERDGADKVLAEIKAKRAVVHETDNSKKKTCYRPTSEL